MTKIDQKFLDDLKKVLEDQIISKFDLAIEDKSNLIIENDNIPEWKNLIVSLHAVLSDAVHAYEKLAIENKMLWDSTNKFLEITSKMNDMMANVLDTNQV